MNPFLLVYDALWDMVASRADLDALVKLGNRIRFDKDAPATPMKTAIAAGDMPELVLAGAGMSCNLHVASNACQVRKRYQWLCSTGEMRIEKLQSVQWMLACATIDWQTILTRLQWPEDSGRGFVKRTSLLDASEGFSDPQRNRGIVGWSFVWGCEVEMWFATADMRA